MPSRRPLPPDRDKAGDRVFERWKRTDTRHMRHAETARWHLDRRAGAPWDRIRDLYEVWFANIPRTAQNNKGRSALLRKLRSQRDDAFVAGFWELYLHESLIRLGYEVALEPDLPGSLKHPDFLASGPSGDFYLEATVVTADRFAGTRRRRAKLFDYLNEHPHPNFLIWIDFRREGKDALRPSRLVRDITEWLDSLDPDAPGLPRRVRWPYGDWLIELTPMAKKKHARGDYREHGELIGIYPMEAGFSDVAQRMRDKLSAKATRYGRLDLPYLVALATNSVFSVGEEEVARALLGPEQVRVPLEGDVATEVFRARDGLLMSRGGPRHTRVSGFVLVSNLAPTHLSLAKPEVWLNPWTPPERRFEGNLPWQHVAIDPSTGVLTRGPAVFDPMDFFGLPSDWPGFEQPPVGSMPIDEFFSRQQIDP